MGTYSTTNSIWTCSKIHYSLSPVFVFKFSRNKEMANYCSGTITFVQPTTKLRNFLYKINDKDKPLESFVCPMPKKIKDSTNSNGKYAAWYYRSLENWGTKWWTFDLHIHRDWDKNITIYFTTAWSPIKDNIIAELSKHCSSLLYEFDEWWMYFSGIRKYVDWKPEIYEDYKDPYYGKGVKCEKCWTLNPKENDECIQCGHQW